MSKLSPGVGMIGTLMGLIEMMANLKDPSQIGSGMALAMITTFYGLLLGTVVYGPFSEKIALESEKSQELDLLILESIVALKERKSSIHMKDIVNTYAKAAPTQKISIGFVMQEAEEKLAQEEQIALPKEKKNKGEKK